jgi:formylglycine-generating enzyme required for sulfatase activity
LGVVATLLLAGVVAGMLLPDPALRAITIDVRLAQGPFSDEQDPRADRVELVIWRLDREGNPIVSQPLRVSGQPPLAANLEPGTYFVVAVGDQGRFHEVYRQVPEPAAKFSGLYRHQRWKMRNDGTIELAEITLPARSVGDGMVSFPGSDSFAMGLPGQTEVPPHRRAIPPFLLDAREVSVADFQRSPLGSTPLAIVGAPANRALAGIGFDQAMAWAEHAGKTLPTESQFEFAATAGGKHRFPWGDDAELISQWPLGEVGEPAYDRTDTIPPAEGLYSNVAEWTATWMQYYPPYQAKGIALPYEPYDHRVVRGAPPSVINATGTKTGWALGPRQRHLMPRGTFNPAIGFRCARSQRPHLSAADFERILPEPE